MKNKKILIIGLSLAVMGAGIAAFNIWPKQASQEVIREISPKVGPIETIISSTGTVLPKNRLEIKPPVSGRIESILVKEGDMVKKGQTLGWLSSTERAALLDAAQGQGEEKLKYWQEVYKAIALVAPIDGEVIVATIQPGQAVTTGDAALVLSDRLIVRADVDETDIGKIKEGQHAIIGLDAYPDVKIKAVVDHIYYESETVNNVTIYKVDLLPQEIPSFFRSGMNANVDFVTDKKDNALLLAQEAISGENGESYVLVRNGSDKEFEKRKVVLGLTQDKNVEIVSGLSADDIVVIRSKKYALPRASVAGKNPFLPSRRPSSSAGSSGARQGGAGGPPRP
jgi:membrane fusion protein, macrolide-specific efflux system